MEGRNLKGYDSPLSPAYEGVPMLNSSRQVKLKVRMINGGSGTSSGMSHGNVVILWSRVEPIVDATRG